ncbi:MAG: hypothetical protein PVJ54_13450, partial [Desulfobacterales bacterium]|jgi:hypothetical protein
LANEKDFLIPSPLYQQLTSFHGNSTADCHHQSLQPPLALLQQIFALRRRAAQIFLWDFLIDQLRKQFAPCTFAT